MLLVEFVSAGIAFAMECRMDALSRLSPTEFENLAYDLLQASGMRNLIWRTPGSDGGRDIEGTYPARDFSGSYATQRWYVECKLYTSSIDWPTVWKKIAYAESRAADFLLLVSNSNPSPQCESEISQWNSKDNRLIVRFWRGYEIEHLLSNYPPVALKYGISSGAKSVHVSAESLLFEMMKIAQVAYVALEFGGAVERPIEANSTLAELISMRLDQIKTYGRFVPAGICVTAPSFSWLTWNGKAEGWEEAGLRAFLAVLRYITSSEQLVVNGDAGHAKIVYTSTRIVTDIRNFNIIQDVAFWADIEVRKFDNCEVHIALRA